MKRQNIRNLKRGKTDDSTSSNEKDEQDRSNIELLIEKHPECEQIMKELKNYYFSDKNKFEYVFTKFDKEKNFYECLVCSKR